MVTQIHRTIEDTIGPNTVMFDVTGYWEAYHFMGTVPASDGKSRIVYARVMAFPPGIMDLMARPNVLDTDRYNALCRIASWVGDQPDQNPFNGVPVFDFSVPVTYKATMEEVVGALSAGLTNYLSDKTKQEQARKIRNLRIAQMEQERDQELKDIKKKYRTAYRTARDRWQSQIDAAKKENE